MNEHSFIYRDGKKITPHEEINKIMLEPMRPGLYCVCEDITELDPNNPIHMAIRDDILKNGRKS